MLPQGMSLAWNQYYEQQWNELIPNPRTNIPQVTLQTTLGHMLVVFRTRYGEQITMAERTARWHNLKQTKKLQDFTQQVMEQGALLIPEKSRQDLADRIIIGMKPEVRFELDRRGTHVPNPLKDFNGFLNYIIQVDNSLYQQSLEKRNAGRPPRGRLNNIETSELDTDPLADDFAHITLQDVLDPQDRDDSDGDAPLTLNVIRRRMEKRNRNQGRKGQTNVASESTQCHRCWEFGHFSRDCPAPAKVERPSQEQGKGDRRQ